VTAVLLYYYIFKQMLQKSYLKFNFKHIIIYFVKNNIKARIILLYV